jgi:hypothetical protein
LRRPLLLVVSIAVSVAGAADKTPFQAKPVAAYAHRQTSENVTIAAEPFIADDQAKDAFGKVNPWRHGVLPVLIVIQNDGKDAIRLEHARFEYILPATAKIEATPAADLKYIGGARQPKQYPTPIGIKVGKSSKGPFSAWEIEGRAFSAKMIPPGQSASGFIYFQAPTTSDAASVYISGIENPVSGKELYYFEIPMSGK